MKGFIACSFRNEESFNLILKIDIREEKET